MTSQIPDLVRYRGAEHVLTAVDGTGLFDPAGHGLRPRSPNTGCWRGFVCGYAVDGERLVLRSLEVGLAGDPALAPVLSGIRPRPVTDDDEAVIVEVDDRGDDDDPGKVASIAAGDPDAVAEFVYDPLDLPMEFTGRLLIADALAEDAPYLHMGYWPAWMYETVHELAFDRGRLRAVIDRSAEAAELRGSGEALARPAEGEPIGAWIDRTFSLDFAYSLPPPRP